ncbi:hypothetical protein [Geodermatophilus amargosae]|uniref:hypothetical protein n=1 Tax=Geodermatophilus amargosae TaxID=1296565 RepID=UPI0034DF8583
MSSTTIRLPEEIADQLIDEGGAEPVFGARNSVIDVISIVVESINTGSALVSIVAGGAACRRIARALMRRQEQDGSDDLVISAGGRTLRVKLSDPAAEDEVSEFLLDLLPPQPPAS